jgi:hypothetical protein
VGIDRLKECRRPPEIESDENIILEFGHSFGNSFADNGVVILTDKKLISRPKKGKEIPEDYKENSSFDIRLEDIEYIRRTGFLSHDLEIETPNYHRRLENLGEGKKIIKKISELKNLERSEWGTDSHKITGAVTSILGIALFCSGIFSFLIAAYMILTIVGIILAIPIGFLGFLMLAGGWKLTGKGFDIIGDSVEYERK